MCFGFFSATFLDNFNRYVDDKYKTDIRKLTRNRKASFKDIMLYPLFQNGFTGSVEAVKFIQEVTGQEDISISQQDIGKQRGYLSPILYKDMFKDYITEFYKNFSAEFEKDGYIWVACDGSICKLPNTNITREQFEIEEDTEFERHWPRARASCIVDVNSGLILTSEFDTTKVTEVEMAKNHLQDLNNDFNLKKFVFIFDRGYGSFELIMALLKNGSKFIIRLDSRTINKERQKMESDDEFVNITMNKLRTKEIKDPELKKNAEQENYLNLRITNIELTNNKGKKYTETLLSNLPIEKFTKKDLKNAYGQRWLIETDYDRLKNILELENFTGHRRTIIEQDFYAKLFMFNLLIVLKLDADKKIQEKHKNKNLKHEYQIDLNHLMGILNYKFNQLAMANEKNRQKIIKQILQLAQNKLVIKNEKRKKPSKRHKGDYQNKKFKHNDRKA